MRVIIITLLFAMMAFSSGFNCQDYSLTDTNTGSSGGKKPIPDAPTNLVATTISQTQINLSWTDNSKTERSFKIERKTLTTQYSLLTTVGQNITSYSDTDLTEDTTYYYRVCAYNNSGDSSYSNKASAIIPILLNAPSALTATAISSSQIDLSWTDNSNNEDGFKIERKVGVGGTYEQLATTATDVVMYSDTTVTRSNTYYYKVKAFKGDEDSSYSPEAYITLDDSIAYWKFDETSGITATDSSGNGNDGTVYGATWSSGTLSFDGVDDYVNAGNSPTLKVTGQMTVQAWFKTSISGTWMTIVGNYDCYGPIFPDNNKKGYSLHMNSAGKILFDVYKYHGADAYDAAETNNAFNDGNWHQAVGIFPANGVDRVQIYIDGALQTVTRNGSVKTDCTASTVNLMIGRVGPSNYGPDGNYFNGQLDDVKIYNYVRTAEDILSDYNADKTHVPIAYWKFDETSGITATDSSGNGNDGTVYGATWSSGTLSFDGTNDYVDAGNSPTLKITGQMTVQAWFKTAITGSYMAMVSNYDAYGPIFPDNNKKGYMLFLSNYGKIQFDIFKYQSVDAYDAAETNNAFNDGNWHQVVGVFPANGIDRVQIYVDGTLQSVIRTGSAKIDCTASTVNLMIGRIGTSNYQSACQYFNGQLDDVKIYNYVRTAEDILSDYNADKTHVPIAYWKFDETSGITATDSSGNGNDGTVYGATWSSGTLSFDGTNDYVDAGNSPTLKITGQMTVQAWFKTSISGTWMTIVGNYDCYGPIFPDNNKKGYSLHMNSAGKILFDVYKYHGADAYDAAETNNAFNDGNWHQAVGIFPANGVDRVQIYIDGALQTVTRNGSVKTDCTASTVNLMIGRVGPSNYGPDGNYFNGQLDDVKIYNYVRSADDIQTDYNNGRSSE